MSVTEDTKRARIEEDEVEIRLSDIVNFLKSSRWTVLKWTAIFLIIGFLYALSSQNEFSATVRVMPELKGASGTGGLSDLKSLAGLAGVNLDNATASEAIRPDLYPDIVQSISFSLYLLKQPVKTLDDRKLKSLQAFLKEQSAVGFTNWLAKLLGNGESEEPKRKSDSYNALQLSPQEEALSSQVNKRVSAAIDKKTGIITISSQMPDPVVAAVVAQQTLDYLTNYVTNYRTGKARQQVQFLSQQVENAGQRYKATEYALSSYRDRNRSLYLNTAKIDEQRLQADYLLAQTVYNDLSKQLEQARIKVQEEAPVFQVLDPARVPLHKSAPERTLIIIGFTVLGAMLGLAAFFVRWFIRRQSTYIS